MVTAYSNFTLDKIIQLNDTLIKHFIKCKDCHLKKILQEALSEGEIKEVVDSGKSQQLNDHCSSSKKMRLNQYLG